ncbi:MAG: hypothetical protein SF187_04060 [Deltaproteobacteria bacterium]|nr:hypothetical protein [Deltaproteobacteria bacterium]
MDPTDQDASADLNARLLQHPNLARNFDRDYPSGVATSAQLRAMEKDREKQTGHSHLLNLPYVLYMASHPGSPDANGIGRSILITLDHFCERFSLVPGFRGAFSPLHHGIWKHHDPEFWSVLALAYVSILLDRGAYVVKQFGKPLPCGVRGQKPKDADLLVGESGRADIYLDVVMKHRPRFKTADEARHELITHADEKVGAKFSSALASGIAAFVIVVCVPSETQVNILLGAPEVLAPSTAHELGRTGKVTACYYALAGSRDANNELIWKLFSRDELPSVQSRIADSLSGS